MTTLAATGARIRGWIMAAPPFPHTWLAEGRCRRTEFPWMEARVATSPWWCRSSVTAEDLPEASFAGQQETFLNVRGEANVLKAMHEVFASLFNDRAISYRVHQGFDPSAVALKIRR